MYTASIITVSDRASQGIYEDRSGPAIALLLREHGYEILSQIIIPDEKNEIIKALLSECEKGVSLLITTGGTGFSERDITPEATEEVITREVPGIAEYMRMQSSRITPRAILSRGISGIRDKTLILNLPGSPKAACENLSFVLDAVSHGLDILNGATE